MKQINGTVTLSFLEEDNQQRVIFRVVPLCTREGVVFREKAVDFPDQGSLRIVPDKREQSTFKERMRSMGCLCAIQLCSEGKELAKVRQNRNYDPGQNELNQFAIYSDVICEFGEDGIFEVFQEGASTAEALSPRVLIRRGQVLYGPVNRGETVEPAALKPFGNDSYLLHAVPLTDGVEHTFYWNPELTVTWRQRRGALRRGKGRPEEGDDEQELAIPTQDETPPAKQEPAKLPERRDSERVRAVEASVNAEVKPAQPRKPERPAAEPVAVERVAPRENRRAEEPALESLRRVSRVERRRDAQGESALPIGTRLNILDESITFEEQLGRLDQPLSGEANLLGRASLAAQGDSAQSPIRTNGTPLMRMGVKSPAPIRHGEPLHYVVEKQIRSAHHEYVGREPEYRHIENPIENLNIALAKVWELPETRQQAIVALTENEAFMQALFKHLTAQGRELRAVEAAQEQLQDIEAERLSLLMQLETAKNDCKRAMEALHADLSHKKREELAQLENQLHAVREEKELLMGAIAALGEQAQSQTLELMTHGDLQLCGCNGDTIALSPMIGVRRAPPEMISGIRVAMNRQGFACNEDDATELLLYFALNDEFCICGDTLSEAELCARTLLEGLGLAGLAARTYDRTALNIASLLPTNGLRTPTVEVCGMERPAVRFFGHKTIRLMDMRTPMRAEPPLPVVYAPAFRAALRDVRPLEPIRPTSLDSFASLREDAKPLLEQGERWFSELDERLSEQRSALYGMASQQMRLFVSAASNRLRGGFLAAADAAVLGWIIPAVCRRELNPEPLRQAIAGLPRCLSALGIQ